MLKVLYSRSAHSQLGEADRSKDTGFVLCTSANGASEKELSPHV